MNGGRAAEAQAVPPPDAPRRDHEILMAVAVGARLFRAPDLDAALNETLAALGRAAGVTRAFLFHIVGSPGSASAELTHEWTAPGIPSLLGNPLSAASSAARTRRRWPQSSPRGARSC